LHHIPKVEPITSHNFELPRILIAIFGMVIEAFASFSNKLLGSDPMAEKEAERKKSTS